MTYTESEQEKERITARIPSSVYETLQRASSLIGVPLNSFIVQAALREAHYLLDNHEITRLD